MAPPAPVRRPAAHQAQRKRRGKPPVLDEATEISGRVYKDQLADASSLVVPRSSFSKRVRFMAAARQEERDRRVEVTVPSVSELHACEVAFVDQLRRPLMRGANKEIMNVFRTHTSETALPYAKDLSTAG